MGERRARNSFVLAALAVAYGGVASAADIEAPPLSPHPHAIAEPVGTPGGDPLQLEIAYTADVWQAAAGGIRGGSVYLDNLDILVEADLDRLLGWEGATAFAYGLYNNGRSLSALSGDAQTASNIETDVRAARLYEAWLEQQLSANTSLRVGLYDLNAEFDVLETSALFAGSAHGTDIGQTGENGPSIFPVTSLAARLAWDAPGGLNARAAVLDGVPGDPARPRRTTIRLGEGDGALLIGEVEAPLPAGKLLLGYWRKRAPSPHSTAAGDAATTASICAAKRASRARPEMPNRALAASSGSGSPSRRRSLQANTVGRFQATAMKSRLNSLIASLSPAG